MDQDEQFQPHQRWPPALTRSARHPLGASLSPRRGWREGRAALAPCGGCEPVIAHSPRKRVPAELLMNCSSPRSSLVPYTAICAVVLYVSLIFFFLPTAPPVCSASLCFLSCLEPPVVGRRLLPSTPRCSSALPRRFRDAEGRAGTTPKRTRGGQEESGIKSEKRTRSDSDATSKRSAHLFYEHGDTGTATLAAFVSFFFFLAPRITARSVHSVCNIFFHEG